MSTIAQRLLCTDLDRTLLPNGSAPESPRARERFARLAREPGLTLAYVTGRHRRLVEEAIREYHIPTPQFVISDVGSKLYAIRRDEWLEDADWEHAISKDWRGLNHEQLHQQFADLVELRLQEWSKQNTHKLSYYVPLDVDRHALLDKMQKRLVAIDVAASLIWSVDELANIGLLDVLPKNATKLHAVEFLYQKLNIQRNHVIFAGDSGNDLPIMNSALQSILVANASSEVKDEALRDAEAAGHRDTLYIAAGNGHDINGNYSAGILEGVCHFWPDFCHRIEVM